jgi:hypothetical protein
MYIYIYIYIYARGVAWRGVAVVVPLYCVPR